MEVGFGRENDGFGRLEEASDIFWVMENFWGSLMESIKETCEREKQNGWERKSIIHEKFHPF